MKIQKGIVKYKDRSDIVCTYGLTDDGLQYYFLDETDTKKFSNGNRIVTTALVEAIDPMVKANNVGVIDSNGAIVIPFENRSIRPVNDNVIVVEKAVPTSQNVLDAVELRNDASAAAKLVSTPAVIKDKINAQMGVEGKYIFNDQFSEATVCDINGSNLVGGEYYSFISNANDKLYLSKNIPESPVAEFSLTTYELNTNPTSTIDVSTAVVDQQVVEDALATQATTPADLAQGVALPTAPVDGMAASVETAPQAPVEGTVEVPVAPVEATTPVVDQSVLVPPVEGVAPVEAAPVDAMNAPDLGAIPTAAEATPQVPAEGTVEAPVEGMVDPSALVPPVAATATPEVPVADNTPVEAAPVDAMNAPDLGAIPTATAEATPQAPVEGMVEAPVDVATPATDTTVEEDVVMEYDDSLSTVKEETVENTEEVTASETPAATVEVPVAEDAMASAETPGEFSAEDVAISDDLKAFANGLPSDEEAPVAPVDKEEAPVADEAKSDDVVEVPVAEETPATEEAPVEDTNKDETTEITDSLNSVSENTDGENVSIDSPEDDVPPIVEEDSKDDDVVGLDDIDVDSEEKKETDDKEEPSTKDKEEKKEDVPEEPVSEEKPEVPVSEDEPKEPVAEDEPEEPIADDKDDASEDKEEVDEFSDNVFGETSVNIFDEVEEDEEEDKTEDVVPFDDIKNDIERTSATPVAIDAETVLATVDKNKNGVIDSDELMIPDTQSLDEKLSTIASRPASTTPLEREYATESYKPSRDITSPLDTFEFDHRSVPSYGASTYSAPSSFGTDYSSLLTDVKPDRISYDSLTSGRDNIMADVARSMSELMRQNKEQRGVITQYQDKVESLESQSRILAEKFKDQSVRYEALSSKLRQLDEASSRLESRNQLLESRIHDQDKIIAAQERELKILRPQVEGKQDLVKLLADARTLLGSDTTSYGYDDGDGYYRRVA